MSFRSHFVMMLVMVFAMAFKAQAQSMWGAGMYGGAGMCNYEPDIGDAAADIADEYDEAKNRLNDLQDEESELKKKLRDIKTKLDRSKRGLETSGFKGDAYAFIMSHIEQDVKCSEYSDRCKDGGTNLSKCKKPEDRIAGRETGPFGKNVFPNYCDKTTSKIMGGICSQKIEGQTGYKYDMSECSKNLADVQTLNREYKIAKAAVESKKNEIADYKRYMRDLKKDYKREVRDYQREQREEMTEGGCIDCMIAGSGGAIYKPYKPSGWEIAAQVGGNLLMGALSVHAGKRMNEHISDNNAKLGFATQSPPSFGYGFPYFMGAMYGAIGGGMSGGAFGCGGGIGGTGYPMGPYGMMGPFGIGGIYGPQGGAFGYPPGMYPGQAGGGVFLPGMGPYGMAGPWGLGNGGMMGMCIQAPCPVGMGSGMPMGMMVGGSFGIMTPYGMQAGGMMGGGYPGMMGGAGMMMPGMMGGGYPGMMGGAGMMTGYPGMMGGAGMMMPGMDGGAGMMQMQAQMQMMQMQMQQAQMMMQMQQRRYENYMASQRVIGGLYQELYTLMYRIQAAQVNAQSGGYLGMDYYGGGMGGGGAMPMPGMPMTPPGGGAGYPPTGYPPPGPGGAPGGGGVPVVR